MCACAEDRGFERRLSRAIFTSLAAALILGGGVFLASWSGRKIEASPLFAASQMGVASFWTALLMLYFVQVRRTAAQLDAERQARRAQEALVGRITLARGGRRRR